MFLSDEGAYARNVYTLSSMKIQYMKGISERYCEFV